MSKAMNETVLVNVEGGVASLTLNRPQALNALDDAMRTAFVDACRRVEQDAAVRVVVLRGAGDHFMAGGDIKFFHGQLDRDQATKRREFEGFVAGVHPIIVILRRMPKPVIASVRGAAAGFGLSLMLAADLVIAAEDSYFTLAYCHIGTSPDGGSTFALPRTVGLKKAMEIALLGERFDAATAHALGLVNWVVPAARLETDTAALAQRLARGPARVYARTKALIQGSLQATLETQLQREAELFAASASEPDFVEGVRAFVEKRTPEFKGA